MNTRYGICIGMANLACLFLASAPAAAKSCNNATLNGAYGALYSGFFGGPKSPTGAIFRLVADGQGNVTGTGTQSDNGTIEAETVTGTYSISKNCTGTMALIDQNDVHADYNFVFDEGNDHVEFVRTDATVNESGEGAALGTATCGFPAKAKRIFANRSREIGTFLVDIVGQVTFDGKGNASAIETFMINGALQTAKMSGTYSVNPDCTGTITLKAGSDTYDFAIVAVDNQQTLLLIDTDPTNINVGIAHAQ